MSLTGDRKESREGKFQIPKIQTPKKSQTDKSQSSSVTTREGLGGAAGYRGLARITADWFGLARMRRWISEVIRGEFRGRPRIGSDWFGGCAGKMRVQLSATS